MSKHATVTAIRPSHAPVHRLTDRDLDQITHNLGACRGATPEQINDTWFPSQAITVDMAREACAGCPVRAECLEKALRLNETEGIWGGTTPDERKTMRRNSLRRANRRAVA